MEWNFFQPDRSHRLTSELWQISRSRLLFRRFFLILLALLAFRCLSARTKESTCMLSISKKTWKKSLKLSTGYVHIMNTLAHTHACAHTFRSLKRTITTLSKLIPAATIDEHTSTRTITRMHAHTHFVLLTLKEPSTTTRGIQRVQYHQNRSPRIFPQPSNACWQAYATKVTK